MQRNFSVAFLTLWFNKTENKNLSRLDNATPIGTKKPNTTTRINGTSFIVYTLQNTVIMFNVLTL
jgi:hypothetical protein